MQAIKNGCCLPGLGFRVFIDVNVQYACTKMLMIRHSMLNCAGSFISDSRKAVFEVCDDVVNRLCSYGKTNSVLMDTC